MPNEYLNFQWKGKTFSQVTSAIKQNVNNLNYGNGGLHNAFLPNPLKIYRRELVTTSNTTTCNPRTSLSIDEINRPGGSIINSSAITQDDSNKITNSTLQNGSISFIDNILPNNSCDETSNCIPILSPGENARRRVRSSGMIPKKFNATRNNDQYYTSTNQYLTSRNRTFTQNQYNFIHENDTYATPGFQPSCVYYKPNNHQFAQQGGVSASALTQRVKYDTVRTTTAPYRNGYGAVASSLAYYEPVNGRLKKSGEAYPTRCTPLFTQTTSDIQCRPVNRRSLAQSFM